MIGYGTFLIQGTGISPITHAYVYGCLAELRVGKQAVGQSVIQLSYPFPSGIYRLVRKIQSLGLVPVAKLVVQQDKVQCHELSNPIKIRPDLCESEIEASFCQPLCFVGLALLDTVDEFYQVQALLLLRNIISLVFPQCLLRQSFHGSIHVYIGSDHGNFLREPLGQLGDATVLKTVSES